MKNSVYSAVKILTSTKYFYFEIKNWDSEEGSDLPKVTESHCTQNSHFFLPLVLYYVFEKARNVYMYPFKLAV